MIFIAHRGNIDDRKPELENHPDYIQTAIDVGLYVEVDVWFLDEYYLGHDSPQYKISEQFLEDEKLFCHAKNTEALTHMSHNPKIHYFWHDKDDFTLTSCGYIWSNINTICKGCILNQPEHSTAIKDRIVYSLIDHKTIKGICSDVVQKYKHYANKIHLV